MATPNISFAKRQVLVTQTASLSGVQVDGGQFNFGQILLKNLLIDAFNIGDRICYDPIGQVVIIYEGESMSIIEEDKIQFKETAAP